MRQRDMIASLCGAATPWPHSVQALAKQFRIAIAHRSVPVSGINLKTAKSLGIIVPPLLLARADEVIE